MFMLRNRAPGRFVADGAKGTNALDRHRAAQMKKEWRKEWDRERLAAASSEKDSSLETLKQRLDTMRAREEAMMSPETRALREAFEASRQQDKQNGYAWMDERGGDAALEDAQWEEEGDYDDADSGPSEEMKKLLPGARWRAEPDACPEQSRRDGWEIIDPDAEGKDG